MHRVLKPPGPDITFVPIETTFATKSSLPRTIPSHDPIGEWYLTHCLAPPAGRVVRSQPCRSQCPASELGGDGLRRQTIQSGTCRQTRQERKVGHREQTWQSIL